MMQNHIQRGLSRVMFYLFESIFVLGLIVSFRFYFIFFPIFQNYYFLLVYFINFLDFYDLQCAIDSY